MWQLRKIEKRGMMDFAHSKKGGDKMHWLMRFFLQDFWVWVYYKARRTIRGEKLYESVPKMAREWRLEDEACEGKTPTTTVRIWKESDAEAIQDLPPGPEHIRFIAYDFWGCIRSNKAIGLVAEQLGSVVGALVTMKTDQGTHLIVRFSVAPICKKQGIEVQLLEFLAALIQPIPQAPIVIEIHEKELLVHLALKKADFVVTMIERNRPEQGESIYVFQRPPHIGWKQGRIRIVDGDEIRTIRAPQMVRQ